MNTLSIPWAPAVQFAPDVPSFELDSQVAEFLTYHVPADVEGQLVLFGAYYDLGSPITCGFVITDECLADVDDDQLAAHVDDTIYNTARSLYERAYGPDSWPGDDRYPQLII